MRIHKLLSDQGVASRRGAERLIEEGRVTVNGRPAVIGQDVNPARDIVHIDGERVAFVKKAARYYILLNKPQLADQALALIALLEPVPPHACLCGRKRGLRFAVWKSGVGVLCYLPPMGGNCMPTV